MIIRQKGSCGPCAGFLLVLCLPLCLQALRAGTLGKTRSMAQVTDTWTGTGTRSKRSQKTGWPVTSQELDRLSPKQGAVPMRQIFPPLPFILFRFPYQGAVMAGPSYKQWGKGQETGSIPSPDDQPATTSYVTCYVRKKSPAPSRSVNWLFRYTRTFVPGALPLETEVGQILQYKPRTTHTENSQRLTRPVLTTYTPTPTHTPAFFSDSTVSKREK